MFHLKVHCELYVFQYNHVVDNQKKKKDKFISLIYKQQDWKHTVCWKDTISHQFCGDVSRIAIFTPCLYIWGERKTYCYVPWNFPLGLNFIVISHNCRLRLYSWSFNAIKMSAKHTNFPKNNVVYDDDKGILASHSPSPKKPS